MGTLLNCIERIPSLIKDILLSYPNNFEHLSTLKGKVKKIVFVASGSSYNAAFTSKAFLERECGLDIDVIYPNVFSKNTRIDNRNILYVFVSQSGTTKLVYENLERANELGATTLAITKDKNTPIAKKAMYFIEMGCKEEEYRYRTIGFSTTVTSCWLLGCYLSSNDLYKELLKVPDSLTNIITASLNWYDLNKFELMKRSTVLFTGSDSLWPIGIEADIKFMEMIPYMTKTYELEEFMHGPQNAFDSSQIFFFLIKKVIYEKKALAMAEFLKNEIGICYLVGDKKIDDYDFYLKEVNPYFYELQYICFFQVIAYELAKDHGRDLSKGINTNILNYLQKSI